MTRSFKASNSLVKFNPRVIMPGSIAAIIIKRIIFNLFLLLEIEKYR